MNRFTSDAIQKTCESFHWKLDTSDDMIYIPINRFSELKHEIWLSFNYAGNVHDTNESRTMRHRCWVL